MQPTYMTCLPLPAAGTLLFPAISLDAVCANAATSPASWHVSSPSSAASTANVFACVHESKTAGVFLKNFIFHAKCL